VSALEEFDTWGDEESRWAWMYQAPCTGMGEIFYPESDVQMRRNGVRIDDTNSLQANYRRARALCATCPHQTECLQEAIDGGEVHGIWGGYSPRDRRKIARGRPPGHPLEGTCRGCGWRSCRCSPSKRALRAQLDLVTSLLDE
jgi:WhiB family redox-sensing transcriptional regulator